MDARQPEVQLQLRENPAHEPPSGNAPAARAGTEEHPAGLVTPPTAATPRRLGHFLRSAGPHLLTVAIVVIALSTALVAWQYYVLTPWTRDGAVRVQVANVAPQISGQIVDVKVSDNQFVRAGDVLYIIDAFDFEVSQRAAKALMDQRAADLEVKQAESQRRQNLSPIATTPEEQQIYAGNAAQAKAAFDAAGQQFAQAEVNLKRTKVLSPVDGYVTNLLLRVGDYAQTGITNISVIDSNSFWIDGYFEETKMAKICIGDYAEAKLMGYSAPITGHVETMTRGISVSNAEVGTQGLPNVNPIYTWVRLAQRVPVRVAIDHVPPGVPLVSGLTATVSILPSLPDRPAEFTGISARALSLLSEIFYGPPPPRPGCIAATAAPPAEERIPVPVDSSLPPASNLEPGLAPGLRSPPTVPTGQ
ncbi:multidrug resistance efflux pump [Ancylobacter sp. 3268]|uniref:HlyD family secretion protein n=1 Tax=Ancylobacter sp. 3268 TaxID=2817752 RepID=UPI0028644E9D|nr:HlyD family secretion protein [Ancylobacter sp. 3268]MDR6955452.1 multidrug resistance efflux pump [Ancylobacter sp. 3268]